MTNIANIIQKTSSKITFQVHDVKINEKPLPKKSTKEAKYNHVIASSHSDNFETINIQFGRNIFARAIHKANDSNYPLLLTPDIIWMVIAQGFTQHINNQSTLRHKFIDRQDKASLKVRETAHYNAKEGREIVSQWGLKIEENTDPQLHQLMLCDFTTTTDTVGVTSKVVMTKTYQQYFNHRFIRFPSGYLATQGIPNITLSGSVDDWKTIRDRVNVIAQYDLKWWTDRLLPICEGFIDTAMGNPPLEFWQHIYKPQGAYGGDVITGWLADLFPYLKDSITHEPIRKNPILSIPRNEITVSDGVSLKELLVGLSETTFTLEEGKQNKELELIGGFIGVTQDRDSKCLKPEIGWGIREKDNLSKLINLLASKHQTKSSPDWSNDNFLLDFPKDIIQLGENLSGVILYPNTEDYWYIKTPQEYEPCRLTENHQHFTSFIKLKNKRCLAYSLVNRTFSEWYKDDYKTWEELWIVAGKTKIEKCEDDLFGQDRMVLIPEETKLIAKSIPQLLERIIAAEGKYYFDDPSFVPDESLDVLQKN